MLLNNLGAII